MNKGNLETYANVYFFSRVGKLYESSGDLGKIREAAAYWSVSSAFSISYGISKNVDISITPKIYQDNNIKGYNFPDGVTISIRTATFNLWKRYFYYGFLGNFRIGTAETFLNNMPLEPYSSGGPEWSITGLLSYYYDKRFPDEALNAHLNLGFLHHMDKGIIIHKDRLDDPNRDPKTDDYAPLKNTMELQYSLALKLPLGVIDTQVELWGSYFLAREEEGTARDDGVNWRPAAFIYGREDYMYITPGIRYKPETWAAVDFSVDIGLYGTSSESNTTEFRGTLKPGVNFPQELPNYNAWKVNIGMNFVILPLKSATYKIVEYRTEEQRKKAFEKLIEEKAKKASQKKTPEKELQQLKQKRQEAEQELEELKKVLEGEE
jgi:hypothetical protein